MKNITGRLGSKGLQMTQILNGMLSLIILLSTKTVLAEYKLVKPKNAKPGAALFVVLHGCLSRGEDIEKDTEFSEYAEKMGFLVMYPEPRDPEAWHGCWEFYSPESQRPGGGDAAVLVDNIKKIVAENSVDPQKIFGVGMSAGASLLSVLTACYPEVLSGVAIHSGMGYGLVDNWQDSIKVAKSGPTNHPRNQTCNPGRYNGQIILIHGSGDQIMNPRHYDLLKRDFFTRAIEEVQPFSGSFFQYSYQKSTFKSLDGVKLGIGIFVKGMNHDWSGGVPMNPLSKRGPKVTPMIIQEFLNKN